jgi:hypothetical protein
MASFDDTIKQIREAIYGRDVRTAIADGIEYIWNQCKTAIDGYIEARNNANSILSQAGPATTAANTAATKANAAATAANASVAGFDAKIANKAEKTLSNVDGSVVVGKIGSKTITSAKIADAAVTVAQIADKTITAAKIADKTITAAKIADNTITAGKIAANAIGASELANGAVDTAAVKDKAITAAKVVNNPVFNGHVGSTGDMYCGKNHNIITRGGAYYWQDEDGENNLASLSYQAGFLDTQGAGVRCSNIVHIEGDTPCIDSKSDNVMMRIRGKGLDVSNRSNNVWKPVNASAFNVSSKHSLKKDFKKVDISDVLDKIMNTNIVNYHYADETSDSKMHCGIIINDDGKSPYTTDPAFIDNTGDFFDVTSTLGYALAAIQQLCIENAKLNEDIRSLKGLVNV